MKLIENWRDAWRFLTIQATTFFAAVWSGWLLLPSDQQVYLVSMLGFDPAKVGPLLAFAMIVVARLKAQPSIKP